MYHRPDRALSEMKAISARVQRAEGKVDLHDISREFACRARMMKSISQTTVASVSDGLVDSPRRKLSFANDPTGEVLAYWRDKELRSSVFVPPPDGAPLDRLGLGKSDTEGEGEAEDGMDEARNIWRDTNVRKYGSGSGGSIRRVKLSADLKGMVGPGVERRVAVLEARVW